MATCAARSSALRGIGPPRDEDVEAILARITVRVAALVKRLARTRSSDDTDDAEGQLLLRCAGMEPCGQVLVEGADEGVERRAKHRRHRRHKALCARTAEGLELHAAVHVEAADRAGLERLCRYMARPPLCGDRLSRLPDGRIEVHLKRTWRGRIRSLLFEPLTFLARLAALIPRPHAHLRRFYGVFAPAHPWRPRIVPRPPCPETSARPVAPKRPAQMRWADLLARVFDLNGLRCPYCRGRLRVVTAVFDPSAIEAIIAAVHLAHQRAREHPTPATPRAPPDDAQAPLAGAQRSP